MFACLVCCFVLGAERCIYTFAFTYNTYAQVEQLSLQAKIADLESAGNKTCQSQVALRIPNDSCPGSDLVDTCWFKVGIFMCTTISIDMHHLKYILIHYSSSHGILMCTTTSL